MGFGGCAIATNRHFLTGQPFEQEDPSDGMLQVMTEIALLCTVGTKSEFQRTR